MIEVTLTVHSAGRTRKVAVTEDRLFIGRTDATDLSLDDPGLSRVHASINVDGERVWVLDEGSTNGTYVNGEAVPAVGRPLVDGDKINVGDYTTIWVNVAQKNQASKLHVHTRGSRLPRVVIVSLTLAATFVIGVVAYSSGLFSPEIPVTSTQPSPTPSVPAPISELPGPTTQPPDHSRTSVPSVKPYLKMTVKEKKDFINQAAKDVSGMIGNRPIEDFPPEVLEMIRSNVEGYARRVGNKSTRTWGEDLNHVFGRAIRIAPLINRSFKQTNVKPVVGLYIVMIESEYGRHCYDNRAGAAGMFQFLAETARAYKLSPADRCNEGKMALAAGQYMRERMNVFGTDATSVALAIAGYNRNPRSVLRDLHLVLADENWERSFWSLIANDKKLDHWFQENKKYVPKFFAAAIVGENPQVFGLQIDRLSSYEE